MVQIELSKLFLDLPHEELECLKNSASLVEAPAGTIIFNEGDPGTGLYLIKSGKVQILSNIGKGEEKIFATLGDGEVFGEMAIVENENRSATAKAIEDSVLYFIPRDVALAVLERSPKLALSMLREISRRLREFNRHYIHEVLQAERLAIVGRFARSIVHDLKNPLNIIGFAADMAAMENATPQGRAEARARIRRQVERISNMISELLEFTQGAHTSVILSLSDYSGFLLPLVDELRQEAALKKVEIVLENEPPAVKVPMAPQRLSRVFYNLVHNAMDAMPNGGKIYMRFYIQGNKVITEIQDTGGGIHPEAFAHLFEAFYTYGKSHGTGLGLSICKRIIEDHNGTIQARNDPQKGGAIFSFALPFQPM
ncbi:MAG: cyclic nucleotide-binding domain-containing protein [Limisphaerales bacterium]|jgi:signal transduction histidine kinase